MEFELPKINVSFEYDEEKDEIVFVINGVEKRVKTADMITEMEKLHEQNTALEQEPCEDCISRQAVLDGINQYIDKAQSSGVIDAFISFETLVVKELPSIQPKPKTDVLDKIRAELHATAEMHEDGNYYLRDEWIDEIFDEYKAESEDKE